MTTTPEALTSEAPAALSTTTNVASSLEEVGSDIASMFTGVSGAVAATVDKLTENGANAASELANTLVDIIAVQQTVYDDDGTIRASVPIMQKTSALALLPAVFPEITNVRLKAQFNVDEIVASGTSSSSSSSSGFGVGLGMTLQKKAFSLGVTAGYNSSSSSTTVSTQTDQASAVGQVRLFQRIQAKEVTFPQPLRVIVGPSITVLAGALQETTDHDETLIRTLSVQIQLRNRNGDPIQGKALSIDTQGVPWTFVPDETAKETNADGNLEILLTRTFPKPPEGAPAPDTAPKATVVSVFHGLLHERTSTMI